MGRSVVCGIACGVVCVLVVGLGAGEAHGAPPKPLPPPGTYAPPVSAAVVDGYRPPATFAGPGNRGWEYGTSPGTVVGAAGSGVVAFAGPIGGRLFVSITHPDGRRTTYSFLASILVAKGAHVFRGEPIATAGATLHFGVRCGNEYQDPATLFAVGQSGPPHLIPTGRSRQRSRGIGHRRDTLAGRFLTVQGRMTISTRSTSRSPSADGAAPGDAKP